MQMFAINIVQELEHNGFPVLCTGLQDIQIEDTYIGCTMELRHGFLVTL